MNKKNYDKPEVEFVKFDYQDVVLASSASGEPSETKDPGGWETGE